MDFRFDGNRCLNRWTGINYILCDCGSCLFAALSYAEFASTVPIAGSVYTYTYTTLGELLAFIIGWDLILEYLIAVSAVPVGWITFYGNLDFRIDCRLDGCSYFAYSRKHSKLNQ